MFLGHLKTDAREISFCSLVVLICLGISSFPLNGNHNIKFQYTQLLASVIGYHNRMIKHGNNFTRKEETLKLFPGYLSNLIDKKHNHIEVIKSITRNYIYTL